MEGVKMENRQYQEDKKEEREEQILLQVHNVTKQYIQKGGGRTGIEGISFTIQRGEFYGIVGESGAGKSTLGKIIAGIEPQDSGTIQFLGKEIQMVFQNPFSAVNPKMKIEKVIMEPWNIRKIGSFKERKKKVEEMLSMVGLESSLKNRYPLEVSGGQLQRVLLARSLMLEPDLLIADEMTASLDSTVQKQMMELLLELRQKRSFACMLISHDLPLVYQMCERAMVIQKGKCVEEGMVTDLWNAPKSEATKTLLNCVEQVSYKS